MEALESLEINPWLQIFYVIVLALISLWGAIWLKKKISSQQGLGLAYGCHLFLLLYVLTIYLLSVYQGIFSEGQPTEKGPIFHRLLLFGAVQGVLCFFGVIIIYFKSKQEGLVATGFGLKNPIVSFSFAVCIYLASVPIYLLFCYLNNLLFEVEPQKLIKEFKENPELIRSWTMLFYTTLLIPITEEVLFRGWLYSGLRYYLKSAYAVGLSALIFALVHESSAMIPVFSLGLILGYIRKTTGAIYPAILIHGAHNALMLIMLQLEG